MPGRHGQDGFTLVELLVALMLIATALTAMLAAFLTSAKSIQSQSERSEGVRIALDRNETLRLVDYNGADLALGTRTENATGSSGRTYTLTTEVVERDARPDEDVAGDKVKDVITTVSWMGTDGQPKSVQYTTAIARDARTIGVGEGYVQSIRSMSVAPDPSVIVDFDGYTTEDVIVTIAMTGHDVSEIVTVSWIDDRAGTQSATATSTDARFWRLTIPKGGGIYKVLSQGQRFDMAFTAKALTSGLTATSSLAIFGPVNNPPSICSTCFTINPNPITTIGNGKSRFENKFDVTLTCTVTGLDTTSSSTDSVRVTFPGEDQTIVSQSLSRISVTGTSATYSHTFPKSTYYFGLGPSQPYTCVAKRTSDGGPASQLKMVEVK